MTTATDTHEELATKRYVDERFDRIEKRLDEIEAALTGSCENYTQNFGKLNNSIASLLNILVTLTGRVNSPRVSAPDDTHRRLMEILERIEKRVVVE